MIKRYHKHSDRRHKSALKPLLFLLLELALLTLICLIIIQLDVLILSIMVIMAASYYFIIYSLKRYRLVRDRQKFYDE